MAYRIIYHPKAEADFDKLHAAITLGGGLRTADDYLDSVIPSSKPSTPSRARHVRQSTISELRIIDYRRSISAVFPLRGNDVFVLGVFARGRDITDEILEERNNKLRTSRASPSAAVAPTSYCC